MAAEKHTLSFTAQTRTLSLGPPKLSARVMLASLCFLVKHSVLPKAVYKHDILEYPHALGKCAVAVFWLVDF